MEGDPLFYLLPQKGKADLRLKHTLPKIPPKIQDVSSGQCLFNFPLSFPLCLGPSEPATLTVIKFLHAHTVQAALRKATFGHCLLKFAATNTDVWI